MWNDFKLRKKAPPRRFLLLVESHARAASGPASAAGTAARTSQLRRSPVPLAGPRRTPRERRYAGITAPGGDQGLPTSKNWRFRFADAGAFGPLGLGVDHERNHTDGEDYGPLSESPHESAPPIWSRLRTAASAGLLITGLALLSLPAHHFIMDDLPATATAAAGLPALASLWAAMRLAQPPLSSRQQSAPNG